MKNIVFYNHFHNGDLHVSRSFIREIMAKIGSSCSFTYSHKNNSGLLSDLPKLKIDSNLLSSLPVEKTFFRHNETVFLNTWYNSGQSKYMSRHGLTFDTLYDLFDDFCLNGLKELLNLSFSLSDLHPQPNDFFAKIDFSKFDLSKIEKLLQTNKQKKVLISNGSSLSGQAENFSFSPVINSLANNHPETLFFCTQKGNDIHPKSNIIFTSDLIGKQCDLNEIAYLSSFCELIIGRASGPWTFAFNYHNLFERKVKFLTFCNLTPKYSNKFWLGDKFAGHISFSSEVICSSSYETNSVLNLIEQNLK